MSTSLAERKMKIPFDTLMDVEGVASKCKTKFSNWEDFVDESLGLFISWWNDPPTAEKIFYSMSPHFTKEMQDFVISEFTKPMDPKLFPTEKEYRQAKERMADELKKYKKRVEEVKKKTTIENLTFNRYNGDSEPEYPITESRFNKIKIIVSKNTNQFPTPKAFFDESIDFSILFWTDQVKAKLKMYDMWDNMTQEMKSWMKKDYPGNYARMEIEVTTYKKQAPVSSDKGAEPETEIVVEDIVQPEPVAPVISSGPATQLMDTHDASKQAFESLGEGYEQTYGEIMELKEQGVWNKDIGDALPYDKYPLIWSFYSRFLPVKLVLSVLAEMTSDVNGQMVDYEKFRKRAYKVAIGLREKIRAWEKDNDIKRNEKKSAGLPLSPMEVTPAKMAKLKASETRFTEHFVGMTTKSWIRKQNTKPKDEDTLKPLKDKNGVAFFDGALNAMGLACFKADESQCPTCEGSGKDKNKKDCRNCYGGGKNYEIRVGLTKLGAQFYTQRSNFLIYYQRPFDKTPLADGEIAFIMDKIIPRFPLEEKFIENILSSLKEIRANPKKKYLDAMEADKEFKNVFDEWIKNKNNKTSVWMDNFKNAQRDTTAATPWRVATMGRLVEMGMIKWDVEKRTGKSLFQLQITNKEKLKERLVGIEEELEGTLEKFSAKERAKEAAKEIESLKNKVLKKLKAT